MAVITGIITAIKIGLRVSKIVYKGGKKIPPVVKYFDRHRKAATIITTAASTAPLIYDLLSIDYDALLPKTPSNKIGKTRGNMVKSRSERFIDPDYQFMQPCKPYRKRRSYRSSYR